MALQKISEASALSPGAQVWLTTNPERSHWARKIDWYLNFQMARAANHTPPILEPGLLQVLRDEELPPPTVLSRPKSPLMIKSSQRLPCTQTVQLPYGGNLADWSAAVVGIWEALMRPSLRVFLPQGISLSDLQSCWPGDLQDATVAVVGDSEQPSTTRT